jgi:hypothetical protein
MMDGSSALPGSVAGKTLSGSGGNNGSGGSGQRVVREVGVGPANWPILTKVNYTEWALIMKIKLQARNLWDVIRDRRCHAVGGSHGVGCDHQCGVARGADITGGEEECRGGVGGGQVPADRQRGCLECKNTTATG